MSSRRGSAEPLTTCAGGSRMGGDFVGIRQFARRDRQGRGEVRGGAARVLPRAGCKRPGGYLWS